MAASARLTYASRTRPSEYGFTPCSCSHAARSGGLYAGMSPRNSERSGMITGVNPLQFNEKSTETETYLVSADTVAPFNLRILPQADRNKTDCGRHKRCRCARRRARICVRASKAREKLLLRVNKGGPICRTRLVAPCEARS